MSGLRLALVAALLPAAAGAIPLTVPQGVLHGFPSMSDEAGQVIADGELTQEPKDGHLAVHIRWRFRDGRTVEEEDTFGTGAELVQERFSWVETRGGEELRRFEVDFTTGKARAVTVEGGAVHQEDARVDVPRGRSFAGYGTALAVSMLPLGADAGKAEITFVAFTPKPRTVTLGVRRDREEPIPVAGRSVPCDRVTLHPEIPFPVSLFVHAPDAHLWFTHRPPRTLVRAEQSLAAKDDPQVVIDVTPRGPARHPAPARRPPLAR